MNELLDPVRLYRHEVFASATMPLLVQRYVLNGTYERHSHDFSEVVFVLAGVGRHVMASSIMPLTMGDLLVVRPGVWHAYCDCQDLTVYNCCFALELLQQPLAWLHEDPQLAALLWGDGPEGVDTMITRLADPIRQACTQQLDLLYAVIASDPKHHHEQIRLIGYFLVLLGTVAQSLAGMSPPPLRYHHAVLAGMMVLKQQLAYPWTLREIAQQLHIDPAYLVRLFTAHLGCAPMSWLARQRAERAANLLATTDIPIAKIAADVGWPDPSHFARRFRSLIGQSASTYRSTAATTPIQPDITHG